MVILVPSPKVTSGTKPQSFLIASIENVLNDMLVPVKGISPNKGVLSGPQLTTISSIKFFNGLASPEPIIYSQNGLPFSATK